MILSFMEKHYSVLLVGDLDLWFSSLDGVSYISYLLHWEEWARFGGHLSPFLWNDLAFILALGNALIAQTPGLWKFPMEIQEPVLFCFGYLWSSEARLKKVLQDFLFIMRMINLS